jgi:hypothetical protein
MKIIDDKIRLEHFKRFDKNKRIFERILFKVFYKSLNEVTLKALERGTEQFINESSLFDAYLEAYEIIFRKHGKKAVKVVRLKREAPVTIGFSSTIFKNKVREYLNKTAGDRITNVNDNTKEQVRKVLNKYEFSGAANIAGKMRKEIKGINKNRAMLIARTESLTGMNYVSHVSAIQEGVTSKSWLHTIGRSKNYREVHLAVSEKVIGINEKWTLNGLSMAYPGDPNGGAINNCNCRCSILYGYEGATKPNHTNLFRNFIAGLILGVVFSD